MSTRATYRIKASMNNFADFYIHHDGYPEGAATYFALMLERYKADNIDASLAESFVRANERAELTRWLKHGDTEYHYEIEEKAHNPFEENKGDFIEVTAWEMRHGEKGKGVFTGSLQDFLAKYNRLINAA